MAFTTRVRRNCLCFWGGHVLFFTLWIGRCASRVSARGYLLVGRLLFVRLARLQGVLDIGYTWLILRIRYEVV